MREISNVWGCEFLMLRRFGIVGFGGFGGVGWVGGGWDGEEIG